MYSCFLYLRIGVFVTVFQLLSLSVLAQRDANLVRDFENTELNNSKRIASLKAADLRKTILSIDEQIALLNTGIDLAKNIQDEKIMFELMISQTSYLSDYSNQKVKQLDNLILACKTKGWDSLQVVGIYWKARVHGLRNEPQIATKLLNELVKREGDLIARYPKIHALVYVQLGNLIISNGDINATLNMYGASLKINEQRNDSGSICTDLYNIGRTYYFHQDFEKFRQYTDKCVLIAQKIKRKDIEVASYNNFANMFGYMEKYDSCLIYGLRVEQLSKELNDKRNEAYSTDIVAACYLNLGQLPKALIYQLRAYTLMDSLNLKNEDYRMCKLALNVGLVYIAMEDYSMASKYYDTAFIFAKNSKYIYDVSNVFNHMGYLYLKEKNYAKALNSFNKASEIEASEADQHLLNETSRGLAMTHEKLGNYEISNRFIQKALNTQNSWKQLVELYKIQANNFEKLGNYQLAYQSHVNYDKSKDSLSVKSNRELEQKILAQYSVEKAEAQVILAERDLQVSDLNAEKQRRMKLFGFLLLGLSLVSILLIVSRHKKFLVEKEKTRKLEQASAQAIIERSRSALVSQSELMLSKNRLIEELKQNLTRLFNDASLDTTGVKSFLDSKILTKEDWDKFKASFTIVHPTFITSASAIYPTLTASELRLLCLAKLGMNKQEIADMLGVLPDSVKRTTNRFIQKISNDDTLTLNDVVNTIV